MQREPRGRGVATSLPSARFLLRRMQVLGVITVVGWAAVTATVEYFGDDPEPTAIAIGAGAASAGTASGDSNLVGAASGASDGQVATDATADNATGSAAEAPGTAAPVTEVATTPPPTTAAPTTTIPEPTGPPTQENPARVYIVGDSDAGTFGPYLKELLDNTGLTTSELNYVVSSGLARPDFFNWPAELQTQLPAVDPDIVVVTFGGNDAQGLALENGDFILSEPSESNRDEWIAEYSARAGAVMDLLLENNRKVVWVGIPNDDNPEVTARMAIQDEAARLAASSRDVVFVDTWKRFSGRDGGWAEFVIDPRDGQGKDVRASDGFHLNTTGAEILAIDIAAAVAGELRELGAAI